MKHRLLRLAAIAALVSTAVLPIEGARAADSDPVVADVNGRAIHRSTLVETYENSQFRQVPLEMVYDQVLDYVVTGEILLDEAKRLKLEDDAKVKEALAAAQARVLQQAYLARQVEEKLTDKAVRARYDAYVKSLPAREEVKARHILLSTEADAKAVIAELKRGASFEELAKAKTQDPTGKDNGGDLGYFSKDEMVPEFAEAAFALKPGETTKTPVKTQFGWHVIKVEDKRKAPPPTFAEAEQTLRAEMAQESVQSVVDGLKSKAKIKRFDIEGKPLPEKPANAK